MADWVIIVDDDETNLKLAGRILSMKGMRVTAFKSGQSLLDYMADNAVPDLILLDIKMPQMDGFETLTRLRRIEKAKDVPVIFLTGDENKGAETRGLSLGAMDFIKKPFVPEVLILRARHIIDLDHLQKRLANEVEKKTEEANTDAMTGLFNKKASEEAIAEAVKKWDGILVMADLDSFKLVNDLYGHDMGDKILIRFSELLRSQSREEDIIGRIGGDEFIIFFRHAYAEEVIRDKIRFLNESILEAAKQLMGEDMTIPLGVSAGGVHIPDEGREYEDVRKKADEALYQIKQAGKHGCGFYNSRQNSKQEDVAVDWHSIEMLFGERNEAKGAIRTSQDQFRTIYRYVKRLNSSYSQGMRLVVFELTATGGTDMTGMAERFGELAASVLRAGDVVLNHSSDKVLVLLSTNGDDHWGTPLARVLETWKAQGDASVQVTFVSKAFA